MATPNMMKLLLTMQEYVEDADDDYKSLND